MPIPESLKIHLVMDNLNIHSRKSLTDYTGGNSAASLEPPHRPLHAPAPKWLNQAEIEISLFSRRYLGKRRIPTLTTLRREAAPGIAR